MEVVVSIEVSVMGQGSRPLEGFGVVDLLVFSVRGSVNGLWDVGFCVVVMGVGS